VALSLITVLQLPGNYSAFLLDVSLLLCDQHTPIMVAVTSFNFLSFPCLKRNYWNKWRFIKGLWENIEIKIHYYFVILNSITITASFYGTDFFFKNYIRKILGRYATSVSSVSARDRAQGTGVLHGMWLLPVHRSPAMYMTSIGHKPKDFRRCSTRRHLPYLRIFLYSLATFSPPPTF